MREGVSLAKKKKAVGKKRPKRMETGLFERDEGEEWGYFSRKGAAIN